MFRFIKRMFGKREEGPPPVALVLLQSQPGIIEPGHLAIALQKAMGKATPLDQISQERISYLRVTVEGYELTVASAPFPYEALKEPTQINERRLIEAMVNHEAFLTIDCWNAPPNSSKENAMPLMGKIIAELCDSTSLAVYSWTLQRVNLVTEELLEGMRAGEVDRVMKEMNYDAVCNVSGEDPRMIQAVAEAKARWLEFVDAFHRVEDREMFIAKGPFTDGQNTEWMWIQVTHIHPDRIEGILQNEPFQVRGLRQGHTVSIQLEELNDWLYVENEEPVGMFTEKIVRGIDS